MNRGWRFCRPLPYHLATAPLGEVSVSVARGSEFRLASKQLAARSGAASRDLEGPPNRHRSIWTVRLRAFGATARNFRLRRARGAEWVSGPHVAERACPGGRGPRSKQWSGKRDSNPRLRPWQGRTLPLSYSRSPELLPYHTVGAAHKVHTYTRALRSTCAASSGDVGLM